MYLKFASMLLLSVMIFTSCEKKEEKVIDKAKAKVVKIFDVKDSTNFLQSFKYPAQVEAFQDVTMAFEVSGKIVKFYYKEGQKVKKGSVIAKLDDAIYKANYNQALANYNQANIDYKRYQKLFESSSVAKVELEKQRQSLDVNRAILQIAKKNLDETRLIAEFDGIMAKKMVDDFARVTAKQAIIRLQDNSSYKIKFFVPESDILQIKGELTPEYIASIVDFYVTFENNEDKKYDAKLIDVSTTAEKTTRTFEATLEMQIQKNVTILPGMTAQVHAIARQAKQKKVFIPLKAVFSDNTNLSFIWLIDENNRVYKQKVETGTLRKDFIEIIAGFKKGEKVVISGIRFLEPNDEVVEYKKLDK